MLIVKTTVFDDPVASESRMTTDLLPSGVNPVRINADIMPPMVPGRKPRGGINYIDETAGAGDTQLRTDAMFSVRNGIVGIRQRRQPMNGDYIARSLIVDTKTTGNVGFRQSQAATRGTSADTTNAPSQGSITAAFTSPALATFIAKMRRKNV